MARVSLAAGLAVAVLLLHTTAAFYLPGVAPIDYAKVRGA